MTFILLHEDQMSPELLAQHSLWAQYHEPNDVEIIVSWGVPRTVVEDALELVHWSDSYIFPVLRSADASKFYFFYSSATFQTASGIPLVGFVSNLVPTSVWVFHSDERLLLNVDDDPELTADEEKVLRAFHGGGPIFPLEVRWCALPLQKQILNPYACDVVYPGAVARNLKPMSLHYVIGEFENGGAFDELGTIVHWVEKRVDSLLGLAGFSGVDISTVRADISILATIIGRHGGAHLIKKAKVREWAQRIDEPFTNEGMRGFTGWPEEAWVEWRVGCKKTIQNLLNVLEN